MGKANRRRGERGERLAAGSGSSHGDLALTEIGDRVRPCRPASGARAGRGMENILPDCADKDDLNRSARGHGPFEGALADPCAESQRHRRLVKRLNCSGNRLCTALEIRFELAETDGYWALAAYSLGRRVQSSQKRIDAGRLGKIQVVVGDNNAGRGALLRQRRGSKRAKRSEDTGS